MPEDSERPILLKNRCPVCDGAGVYRDLKALGIRTPAFRCADCGAGLTTALTLRSAWGFVFAFGMLPVLLLGIPWMNARFELGSAGYAMLVGASTSGTFGISMQLVLRGMVFKSWKRRL